MGTKMREEGRGWGVIPADLSNMHYLQFSASTQFSDHRIINIELTSLGYARLA